MKIGLFGGSFNPIHKGHIKIAKEAIKVLKLDKLIFIPCQKNPLKKDVFYVDGKQRLKMIKIAIKDEEKMSVSSFEIDRTGISYTIDTIRYFKNKYKNDELYFILGSDNLTKLQKWKSIKEISELAQLAIFKRSEKINKTNAKKYNAIIFNNKIYKASSREFLNGAFDILDKNVLSYIGKEKIYFEQILKNILDQKRYLHSLHAKEYAIKLAKAHKYDVKKASFAALVHDIAKHIANDNKEIARKIIEKYEPKNKDLEDYQLHQEVGYIILKHIFNVEDDICNAVRIHTSLSLELTTLDKIVFLADKLCQGRKYAGIQKDREISLKNLNEALKNVIERIIVFNKEKNVVFTPKQQEIYSKWVKTK